MLIFVVNCSCGSW